jgi:phthalate 4,5-dioxygenase reductase subunit
MIFLRVTEKREAATGIFQFVLVRQDGLDCPAFSAGAHLLVKTPSGEKRRYSICNPPAERSRYIIAVKHEIDGGGGSSSMVHDVSVGTVLEVEEPQNYFPLIGNAKKSILIAGGIGITPILAMAHHLHDKQRSFEIIYCSRSPETTAFYNEIKAFPFGDVVRFHHDLGDPAKSLDFSFLSEPDEGCHLYCCGPRPLMQAVRDAIKNWSPGSVHFEDFGTSATTTDADQSFEVILARSNRRLVVRPETTILQTLREAGVAVPSSCESGTCGTCRVALLAGTADHRDFLLDEDEYENAIMICVSRAQSDELTLDI